MIDPPCPALKCRNLLKHRPLSFALGKAHVAHVLSVGDVDDDIDHGGDVSDCLPWFQGIQTFIAANATLNNTSSVAGLGTWGVYPDDEHVRLWMKGDSRAALMPFLAFRWFIVIMLIFNGLLHA
jgi:hypothetical protein